MSKNNVRKLIVCVIMILLLVFTVKTVSASNTSELFNQLTANDAEEIREGENTNTPNAVENNALNTNTNTNTSINNTTENKPATAPDTGLSDGSTIVFIGLFIVSAIYAFIRVKKYEF